MIVERASIVLTDPNSVALLSVNNVASRKSALKKFSPKLNHHDNYN